MTAISKLQFVTKNAVEQRAESNLEGFVTVFRETAKTTLGQKEKKELN